MWAFFEPARGGVIPNITGEEELLVANTLSSTTWSVIQAVGFAAGGVVAAAAGRDAVFVINAGTFLASAALIQAMRFDEPHLRGAPPVRARELADFSPMMEGLRYIGSRRRLLAALLAKTGLGLMGTTWVILPVLGERDFPVLYGPFGASSGGLLGMSFLLGARGLGSLVGPLAASRWAGREQARLLSGILYGFVAGAAGLLMLGWASSFSFALAAIVLAHAGGSTVWVFTTTILQTHTDDRFRGRVLSADFAFHVVIVSAAAYLAGVFIDQGASPKLISAVSGASMLLPALAWAVVMRLWGQSAADASAADDRNP